MPEVSPCCFPVTLLSHGHKNSMVMAEKRHVSQWRRTEDSDINSQSYSQAIAYKGAINTHWRTDSLFNRQCRGKWVSGHRKMNVDIYLSLHTRLNSKQMEDCSVRLLANGQSGKHLKRGAVLDTTLDVQEIRPTTDRMQPQETAERLYNQENHQPTKEAVYRMGENLYQLHV